MNHDDGIPAVAEFQMVVGIRQLGAGENRIGRFAQGKAVFLPNHPGDAFLVRGDPALFGVPVGQVLPGHGEGHKPVGIAQKGEARFDRR